MKVYSVWMRTLTQRGRRFYLAVACGLFMVSLALLVIRSWNSRSYFRDVDFINKLQIAANDAKNEHRLKYNKKDQLDGLSWIVQVSDIHLRAGDEMEIQHFQEFVEDALNILKPSAVLVTGDLTNSKTYGVKVAEIPEEWSIYRRVVKERISRNNSSIWLDIAGNHDNFDEVAHSYFKANAVQSSFTASRTALGVTVAGIGGQNITFLPVDASLKPGIRAYNFLGYLPEDEFKNLHRAAEEAHNRGDIIVFYGHYPISTIVSSTDLTKLLSTGSAYVCGHLHTGFGTVDPMWTRHPNGLMELELSDWAHTHRFRILAFDDGRLTWIDVTHPTWPVVMISSVKRLSLGENNYRFMLRLLVFTDEEIAVVSVRVDDNLGHWISCVHNFGPLFTATVEIHYESWDRPANEKDFIRNLQVLVGNSSGSKTLLRIGSNGAGFELPKPSFLAGIILSLKVHDVFIIIYVTGVGLCCVILILGKYQVRWEPILSKRLITTAASFCHNNTHLGFLFALLLYPLIGPWYVGRLAGDMYGVVFMWGIFVGSTILPGELTYPDAFFLWTTLQFPAFLLIFIKRWMSLDVNRNRCNTWLVTFLLTTLGLQLPCILAWLFLDSILLNGPIRLGLLLVVIYLWRKF
ncbi:transmembrane protein 62-like isoform X1 [Palaemon carinicauda]|uniref:transmembrane protein 62-like isoform X1 n=1 Tax=Palaemon carinicauda TaxID=392227 RepID=UPI0035B5A6DF